MSGRLLAGILGLAVLVAVIWSLLRPDHNIADDPLDAMTSKTEPEDHLAQVDSAARRDTLSSPESVQESLKSTGRERIYPKSLIGLLDDLKQNSGEESAASRHAMSAWLNSCVMAAQFERMGASAREHLGLHAETLLTLREFCADTLQDDLNLSDAIDMTALRELENEYFESGSLPGTHDELNTIADDVSLDAATRSALEILANSLDEGAMWAALDFMVAQEAVDPPFPEYPATRHMYDPELQRDVVLVLLCDRVGGCGAGHPITVRRCIESRHGCYRPNGIQDAIWQTVPPLQYEATQALHRQVLALIRVGRL